MSVLPHRDTWTGQCLAFRRCGIYRTASIRWSVLHAPRIMHCTPCTSSTVVVYTVSGIYCIVCYAGALCHTTQLSLELFIVAPHCRSPSSSRCPGGVLHCTATEATHHRWWFWGDSCSVRVWGALHPLGNASPFCFWGAIHGFAFFGNATTCSVLGMLHLKELFTLLLRRHASPLGFFGSSALFGFFIFFESCTTFIFWELC